MKTEVTPADNSTDNRSVKPSSKKPQMPDAPVSHREKHGPEGGEARGNDEKSLPLNAGAPLEESWSRLVDIIAERHPSIAPNLAHSKLVRLTDNRLEIEVNGSVFNLNRIKKRDSLHILREISSDFFNKKMDVKIRAGKGTKNTNGRQDKEKVNRLKSDLLRHPVVADAIEIFNGKLVDVDVS
jgi:DNA polymerase-3 subunit gamma/tau